MFSYQEAYQASLDYFNNDDLASKVFLDKYALRDNNDNLLEKTPEDMHHRIAKEFARIEKKKFKNPLSKEEIFSYLDKFKYIVPQGSPLYGIGNSYHYVTLSNCYVIPSPEDSYSGIMNTDEYLVQISKRRGGVGLDISKLRPNDTPTTNSARTSTGILPFMERYSNSIREVGQSGRRGALMITISVHHPQILDFIKVKNDRTKVTGANISVRLTNEFLDSVKKNKNYELRLPVNSDNPQISKKVSAREIWHEIIKNAHEMAEPGLLFWDNIIKESPADCYKKQGFCTTSTNPCSEIPLCENDSCRLLLLNLFSYVEEPFTNKAKFNFDKFYQHSQIAQRLMDNLVDLELESIDKIIKKIKSDPEPPQIKQNELDMWIEMKKICKNGRRTGTGITALGDTLAALRLPYTSKKGIKITTEIYKTLKLGCYRSSIDMAKEIGPFPIWNKNQEKDNPFLLRIKDKDEQLYKDMQKYGRRNIALLTTAPAGSVSILTQTTSGIEPAFMLKYTRRKKINPNDKNSRIDFTDQNGDHWQEFTVYHPKVKEWMKITGETDIKKSPWFNSCAEDLNWEKRVELQAKVTKHVDHSISSCLVEKESFIQTTKGLISIEEFVKDKIPEKQFAKPILNTASYNIDNNPAKITSIYNNGKSSVLKLTCINGYEITCTPNHKLLTLDKNYNKTWIPAKDINKDQILIMRKGLNLYPHHKTLNIEQILKSKFVFDKKNHSKNITIPKFLTKDLCRLLGYLCSDGCVSVNGIGLCQKTNNICDDFIYIIKTLFNKNVAISNDKRSTNLVNLVVNSREISHYFKWLGITTHDIIQIPKIIRYAHKEHIKEFIKGCTLDGYVAKDNICVATSISKKYLQQLQLLLLNLNITTTIIQSNKSSYRQFPNSKKKYLTKDAWSLVICVDRDIQLFLSQIGFAEHKKQQKSLTKIKRTSRIKFNNNIPDYGLRKRFRDNILPNIKSQRLYDIFHSLTCKDKQNRELSRESIKEMVDLGLEVPQFILDDTHYFIRVKSIEYLENRQTFDLSVPVGNSYIANGFVSHNTINLPEDISVDEVKKIYEKAWTLGCKGLTVYRKNCRTGVLVDKNVRKNKIYKTEGVKRPKTLSCDVYHISVQKQKYFVIVGLIENDPYEILAGPNGNTDETAKFKNIKEGQIVKVRRGLYKLESDEGETLINSITDLCSDSEEAITRMISTSLRHGTPINYIVHQLEKVKGDLSIFSKSIARALKKYTDGAKITGESCPECGMENLKRECGCISCSCGWTKCM